MSGKEKNDASGSKMCGHIWVPVPERVPGYSPLRRCDLVPATSSDCVFPGGGGAAQPSSEGRSGAG